jgi:hypothetical protein
MEVAWQSTCCVLPTTILTDPALPASPATSFRRAAASCHRWDLTQTASNTLEAIAPPALLATIWSTTGATPSIPTALSLTHQTHTVFIAAMASLLKVWHAFDFN